MGQFKYGMVLSVVCLTLLPAPSAWAMLVGFGANWMAIDDSDQTMQEKRVVSKEIRTFGSGFTGLNQFNLMIDKTKPVKNAPYSAEAISEFQQKLVDGNVISNKSSSYSFRDAMGRTRDEYRDAKGELKQIFINDPDTGRMIINPRNKTVMKIGELSKNLADDIAANKMKNKGGEEVFELHLTGADGKAAGRHVIVAHAGAPGETSKAGTVQKNVTIDVRGADGVLTHERLGGGMMDSALPHLFSDAKWAGKRQTKSLGSRFIEGVKVDGKLTSYEIPAGEIGNAQAIIVSDETWVSPELEITLYSKHSDPRSGDRIYRLSNLKRVDSEPSLFTAPAGYTVTDVSKNTKSFLKFESSNKEHKVLKLEKKQ